MLLPTPKSHNQNFKLIDLIHGTQDGSINPDPLAQRPPVTSGQNKSIGILSSLLSGYSVGSITVRSIKSNKKLQDLYAGAEWLVIDGGHRIRAFRDFFNGDFGVNGMLYRNMSEEEKQSFRDIAINVVIYDNIDDEDATNIFRSLNTVTPVNTIEMIMANESSLVARFIREYVKTYREYDYNKIHGIFSLEINNSGKTKAKYWSTDINPRRKWEEFVAVVLLKALGGGNVNAGLEAIAKLVDEDEPIPAKIKKTVDKFFDDTLKVFKHKGQKLNASMFGSFHCVWFGLFERGDFNIKDYNKFAREFFKINSKYKGKTPNENDERTIEYRTGERGTTKKEFDTVKKFARMATEYPSNPAAQHQVSELYLDAMDLSCVTMLAAERTMSRSTKFDMLASQGFKCYLDGQPVDIEDAIYGHDLAYHKGGETDFLNGKIVRKSHNEDMGGLTFKEYLMVLNMRKQAA